MAKAMISPGHVLLTGASAGIGEALAHAFAREGLRLTLVARRKDRLEALASAVGGAEVIEADLSDPSVVDGLVEEAEARSGAIDHLVNNAGSQIVSYGWDIDPDEGERMLRLNLLTPLRLIRRCVPGMRARGQGSLVNISSVAGFASPSGMAWYAASKSGLAAASETLVGELRGSGVHVLTVYPGPVRTELGAYGESRIQDDWRQKMQQWGEPDALADEVLHALKKRRHRLVYPKSYAPLRHTPGVVGWALQRLSPPLKPE
jgi:short-subunit dehydrogenase